MYLAIEIGTIDLNPILKGVVASLLYFVVGMAVLVSGFYMVDVLTPESCGSWCSSIAAPTPSSSPARCISP